MSLCPVQMLYEPFKHVTSMSACQLNAQRWPFHVLMSVTCSLILTVWVETLTPEAFLKYLERVAAFTVRFLLIYVIYSVDMLLSLADHVVCSLVLSLESDSMSWRSLVTHSQSISSHSLRHPSLEHPDFYRVLLHV